MKKALVKTEIYRFFDNLGLKSNLAIDDILNNSIDLYNYLKNNPYFGDLTENQTFEQFEKSMRVGFEKAINLKINIQFNTEFQ